ncbi:MAG TPA: hypothetical protein VMW16_13025 [Sedimentisphaerales bacterium]|nr:hypothetical protein [Sedimentisphaerales bacterium]
MKKKRDILNKAVSALKNQPVPDGPPAEVINGVAEKLSEAGGDVSPARRSEKPNLISFAKVAAAAVLLIIAGYAAGRLTAPRPPDLRQLQQELEPSLRASLQPAIRQELLDELKKSWRLAWAGSYVQIKDELGRQFSSDMTEFGAQILAASGRITDRRLTELIEAIDAAQINERRWIAAALEQMELNRLQDKSRLMNGLVTLAAQTDDELARTKQDMAQFLFYTRPDSPVPDESDNTNNLSERGKK